MRLLRGGLALCIGALTSVVCCSADLRLEAGKPFDDSAPALPITASPHLDAIDVAERYGRLPMAFEKNRGQASESVDFVARGAGYRVLLSATGANLDAATHGAERLPAHAAVRMRFLGARSDAAAMGLDALPGSVNYLKGNDAAKHLTDIETFARVRYAGIYPGIDLDYYGNQQQLEFDLAVAPGADPRQVRIAFDGVDRMEQDDAGNVRLHRGSNALVIRKPLIYQGVGQDRQIIEGGFAQLTDHEIGFRVAAYEKGTPLVIDPVLAYSTYLGGSSIDIGLAIAVDAAGYAYLAGHTSSTDFPLLNAYDRSVGRSDQDLFVAKLNPAGSALVYATYLGGAKSLDSATGIAIDRAGNAYVTGSTSGSDFPVTTGAYQKGAAGGGAFVAKLNPTGNALSYSTYLLGASDTRIAVDAAGSAYLAGTAKASFATTPGAFQPVIPTPGGTDPFVAKLTPTGTAMDYATFLGGSGVDAARGIAVDRQGSAFVAGFTASDDFPVVSPLQPARQGGLDGFVAKLNPAGTGLDFASYLGGTLDDSINAIAVDLQGGVYLAGETYSANFPVRNAFQPVKAGSRLINSSLGNAFVAKLTPGGNALEYSSFLGGEICTGYCQDVFGHSQFPGDGAHGIAVDAVGHAYVTGLASSYTFPLVDSLLPEKTGDGDDSLFVTKIGLAGNVILYSTFVRTGYEVYGSPLSNGLPWGSGNAIAVDSAGGAYVVSEDDGLGGLLTTAGSLQPATKGGEDAVAFKLSSPSIGMALVSSANPASSQATTTLTASVDDAGLTGTVVFMDGTAQLGSAPLSNGRATLATRLRPGIRRLVAVLRSNGTTADSTLLYQAVNTGLACN